MKGKVCVDRVGDQRVVYLYPLCMAGPGQIKVECIECVKGFALKKDRNKEQNRQYENEYNRQTFSLPKNPAKLHELGPCRFAEVKNPFPAVPCNMNTVDIYNIFK